MLALLGKEEEMRNYILKNKKAVRIDDIEQRARQFDRENRVVKQEQLPNGKWVSTVFLGIDHSFGGGPPLLFETMVFPSKENFRDLGMDRYTTWEEAEKGHKKMVKKWSKKK